MSLNFRFSFTSPNLYNKAHRDISRLTQFIKERPRIMAKLSNQNK